MPSKYDMITILGHTAGGKTAVAACLAHDLNGEVISGDSRQVYRGMDLGTGKDYTDYRVDGVKVPYHLIDIIDAGDEYNVFEFQKDFLVAYQAIQGREKLPVFCGGTGMYIESVLRRYEMLHVPVNHSLREELEAKDMDELAALLKSYKALHNTSDTDSRKRIIRAIEIAEYSRRKGKPSKDFPEISSLNIGISFDRETRRSRITERLKVRLEEGMVEEAKFLLDRGVGYEKLEYYGLEYKYLSLYLRDEISYEEMFRQLNTAIHRFAKRQMTYFRGMEKRGVKIHWINGKTPLREKVDMIRSLYEAAT